MEKRARTPNFTEDEVEVLLDIVRQHKDIIECKITNNVKNREKASTWIVIQDEFNRRLSNSIFRSHSVLKNKYSNIKKRANEKSVREITRCRGTGERQHRSTNFNDTDNTIISEIVDEKRLDLYTSDSDDNNEYNNSQLDPNVYVEEDILYKDTVFNGESDSASTRQVIGEHAYNDGKTKQNCVQKNSSGNATTSLRAKRRDFLVQKSNETEGPQSASKKQRLFKDKVTVLVSGKDTLSALQEDAFSEEHALKMKLMQEAHDKLLEREERLTRLREEKLRAKIDFWKLKLSNEKSGTCKK